jgi:CRISPR-associated protein Csm4
MQTLKLTLQAQSAFGTPLAGDTLFGHLCWALRWRLGVNRLTELLQGYTQGQPFAVLSDAFPVGYIPRPSLPSTRLGKAADPSQRKAEKLKQWLPTAQATHILVDWLEHAAELPNAAKNQTDILTQNTINRLTGTTGTGMFAPRQVERLALPSQTELEVYFLLDTQRLAISDAQQALQDIGACGYGRDASTGLGKFSVLRLSPYKWPSTAQISHFLTLAPCAPEPTALNADDCYYQTLTRFGRHGGLHAISGQPFKKPLLMLRTGALLAWTTTSTQRPNFHGCGLGGLTQPISAAEPATVHQGYAPLVPVWLAPLAELGAAA